MKRSLALDPSFAAAAGSVAERQDEADAQPAGALANVVACEKQLRDAYIRRPPDVSRQTTSLSDHE